MADRILITGATGFLGSHLRTVLKAAGYTVCEHSLNVSDIADSLATYGELQHVFHLAARTFVPESWRSPIDFYRTNVLGTVRVAELCRQSHAGLTLISSYVYGRPTTLPITENHPVHATNPYAHTKILSEDVARFYGTEFGIPIAIVRPFNIYGPGQQEPFLIPALIRQAVCEPAVSVADLRPRRDYVHVSDVVALLLRTLECRASGVYNAGCGQSVSVGDLAAMIIELVGINKPLVSANSERPGEIPDVVADTTKARTELGWAPAITLREGLSQLVAQAMRGVAPVATDRL